MVAVLLAISGIFVLLLVVVLRSKLKRFAMRLKFWKAEFSVEIDAETGAPQPVPPRIQEPIALTADELDVRVLPQVKSAAESTTR
jgi:hypothetical protein